MRKTQAQAVLDAMVKNGGFASLMLLYHKALQVEGVEWNTKTPEASIRRIVQENEDIFFKIKPGLWALREYKGKLPKEVTDLIDSDASEGTDGLQEKLERGHSYYQGFIVQTGNLKDLKTYVPPQDRNKLYVTCPMKDLITVNILPEFTYKEIVSSVKTIDVIWFREDFPIRVFEIEHSTNFSRSLEKFHELRHFNLDMFIVAASDRKKQFEDVIQRNIYNEIRRRVRFLDYEGLDSDYSWASLK